MYIGITRAWTVFRVLVRIANDLDNSLYHYYHKRFYNFNGFGGVDDNIQYRYSEGLKMLKLIIIQLTLREYSE